MKEMFTFSRFDTATYSSNQGPTHLMSLGSAVALWLVRSSPDQAVRIRALAGEAALGRTLYYHSASLNPSVYTGTADLKAGDNTVMNQED